MLISGIGAVGSDALYDLLGDMYRVGLITLHQLRSFRGMIDSNNDNYYYNQHQVYRWLDKRYNLDHDIIDTHDAFPWFLVQISFNI